LAYKSYGYLNKKQNKLCHLKLFTV